MSLQDILGTVCYPQKPTKEREPTGTFRPSVIQAFGGGAGFGRSHLFDFSTPPASADEHGRKPAPDPTGEYGSVHDERHKGWTAQDAHRTPVAEVFHHCIFCWWFGPLQEHDCDVLALLTTSNGA